MRTPAAVRLLPLLVAAGCATPRYLAKVDRHEIDRAELRDAFAHVHEGFERALTKEDDIMRVLDTVIDRRLLIAEAYRLGLEDDPFVHEQTDRELHEQLVKAITKEELETNAAVAPEEIQAAYALSATMLKVRQIVVATKEDAEALRARAVAGESFEALAREKSLVDSALRGGLVAPIWWGQGDEAQERAVFAAEKGAVTPVFQSADGWELDWVEDRLDREKQPFEKVEEEIRGILQKRRRAARRVEVLAALRAKYGLELGACEVTPEKLQAALKDDDATACATWRGGKLTMSGLAKLTGGKVAVHDRAGVVQVKADLALLAEEARARGYATRPEIVQAVFLVKEAAMENALYRQYIYRDLRATDDDVKAFWAANPKDFTDPEKLVVAHIAVNTREEAERVRAQAAAGASFEDLAKANSIDKATATKGGVVGPFTRAQLEGTFEALSTLGKGDVSPVMPNKTWFHVAKVVDVLPERLKPLEEVAAEARQKVLDRKARELAMNWITRLRGEAKIKVNAKAIRAFALEKQAELDRELATDPENPEVRAKRAAAAKEAAAAKPAEANAPAAPAAAPATPAAASTPAPAAGVSAPAPAGGGTAPAPAAAK